MLVAGDSDYVPLAQRCKRLGRSFVGIGVAGSTSPALVSACDEFQRYEKLPGVATRPASTAPGAKKAAAKKPAAKTAPARSSQPDEPQELKDATALLVRAVRVGLQNSDDEWVYAAGVKSQMQRMNPAFKEKSLGFSSFRAFTESRSSVVESKTDGNSQVLRLR